MLMPVDRRTCRPIPGTHIHAQIRIQQRQEFALAQALASLDMVRRLVAMDTTSRNSNLEIIDFIRDYLGKLGIESRLVHDETGRKANLYATLGPTDKPGIALSGHTDVVPIDGQEWSSDPWTITERGKRL